MKKLFTILLSAALMIGLAAPLTAAEGKKAKSEKTEKPKKKKRVWRLLKLRRRKQKMKQQL